MDYKKGHQPYLSAILKFGLYKSFNPFLKPLHTKVTTTIDADSLCIYIENLL